MDNTHNKEEKVMAKIKHIALTTQDPDKVAAFYKEAFDLQEIRRSPNGAVFLTDGYINLAILNWKLEKVQAQQLTQKDELDTAMGPRGPRNFEMKWAGPDGVVIDISHTGWAGT